TDVNVYDTNNDGTYHEQPEPVRDGSGHLVTTVVGGLEQLTYPGGTPTADRLQPMRDADGHILYSEDAGGYQTPIYNDDGIASKVERRTLLDTAQDTVTINGSGINDRFQLSSTAGTAPLGGTYTITRDNFANTSSPTRL